MRHIFERPTLILLMGVAGSGKTTLARRLLRRLHVFYVDNNFIADAFFPETRTDAEYLADRPRFYAALYRIVEENLAVGNSVLLDAPHVRQMESPVWRCELEALLCRTASDLAILRCRASDEVIRGRLRARAEQRDHWKLEHWEAYREEEPGAAPIPLAHLDLDTERSLESVTEAALRFVLAGEA